MFDNNSVLIVTGTDPVSKKGGIAFALPGYFSALENVGIQYQFVPTHDAIAKHGKWLPWLKAFYHILIKVWQIRSIGNNPVLYCHVGGGVASFMRQTCIAWFAKLLRVESIMQLHGLEVDGYLDNAFKQKLFRIAIAPASRLAVLTNWWKDRLLNAGVHKAISVIPNPLPAEWEKKAHEPRLYPSQNNLITIFCMARLELGKGVDDLIEAFALLPDTFCLIIAGDGDQFTGLQDRVSQLNLEQRVAFKGWVAGYEKQHLFDNSDIFCLPSRYDSFGMGYLESMANGLPVVAYRWGAISDVVVDGRCGYLAKEYTPGALAESITQLSDKNIQVKMSIEGKKWVLEEFSSSVVGSKIIKMLQALNIDD